MAILSNHQLEELARYTPFRQAHIVPMTNQGEIYKSACWNWALTGGTVNANDPHGAPNIYETIIQFNYYDPQDIYAVGINDVDDQFAGCRAEFAALRNNLADARAGNARAQKNYLGF